MPISPLVKPLSFNTGIDAGNITIARDDTNAVVTFGLINSFEYEPVQKEIDSEPINLEGEVLAIDTRHRWTGSFAMDRSDGRVDALEDLQEQGYHTGQNQYFFTITVSIPNRADPTQPNDVYQFTKCAIKLGKTGPFKLDQKVEQMVTFRATRRNILSGQSYI